jgi:hypothetical protein
MKLSKKTIGLILEAANLGKILGIEGVILDEKGMRGYNDTDGIIIAALGDHGFEFPSLGVSRLIALKQKFNILKAADSVEVEAVEHQKKDGVIEKLHFVCGKVDFEFRCALASTITDISRTDFNLTPRYYFDITESDVQTISQGAAAMRSKHMTIQHLDGEVQFRFSDETGDILNFRIDGSLSKGDDIEEDQISLTLDIKKMFPIFKLAVHDGKFRLNILKGNIIHVVIDSIDVLVMPEV